MTSYRLNNMAVTVDREGAGEFTKATFPIRYGRYSEIKTSDYEFHFNLKGEIKFIRGLGPGWRHPGELLKRTDGNDWVYYSLGSVGQRIFSLLGEYYLPCLPYVSNYIWEFNPFTDMNVMRAFAGWSQLYGSLREMKYDQAPAKIKDFLDLVAQNDESALFNQSKILQSISGERISVLPPDTRHVDYEVIPLMIADGCLYHCDFCCVKSPKRFSPRSRGNILEQIEKLKVFYQKNLENYKGLFLGNHDALGAGSDLILMAVSESIKRLDLQDPILFLFGSVDSLLRAEPGLFDELDSLCSRTYINLGLESLDPDVLSAIKKPLDAQKIRHAFNRMMELNQEYANIELTANFLMGEHLPPGHIHSLLEMLKSLPDPEYRKGAIYLSPLLESRTRTNLLNTFYEIKNLSPLPAYIYLIQRL